MWPFRKAETRSADYTDLMVAQLIAGAKGEVAGGRTSAIEIAAGHWQRAFASATVTPSGVLGDALAPHLGYIGRSLLERGESIFEISMDGGFGLLPASNVSVHGDPDPRTWQYQLTLSGPSGSYSRLLKAERVLHLTYSTRPEHPWQGISPITAGLTTKKLLDNLENRLAQETSASVGTLIPVPNVQSSAGLQRDIQGLDGRTVLVESVAATKWGQGAGATGFSEYVTRRVGANPPEVLVALRRQVEESILSAAGIPQSVLTPGQGTAAREGFRQFLHAVIQPIALEIAGQIGARFETDVSFNFDRLMASDLSGRARAFQSMVGGGMDVSKAAALAGLMETE